MIIINKILSKTLSVKSECETTETNHAFAFCDSIARSQALMDLFGVMLASETQPEPNFTLSPISLPPASAMEPSPPQKRMSESEFNHDDRLPRKKRKTLTDRCEEFKLKSPPVSRVTMEELTDLPAELSSRSNPSAKCSVPKPTTYSCVCGQTFTATQHLAVHCRWCSSHRAWLVRMKEIPPASR